MRLLVSLIIKSADAFVVLANSSLEPSAEAERLIPMAVGRCEVSRCDSPDSSE